MNEDQRILKQIVQWYQRAAPKDSISGTYPCFEELVVDLKKTRQLDTYLLRGGGYKAYVPIKSTYLLLQKLY